MLHQNEKAIIQLYVGYYDRAPDSAGLAFWIDQSNAGGSLFDIANSFAAGSEYQSIYGGLSSSALIDRIYDNLFNRAPDAAGKAYWQAQLDGGMASASLIVNVISGAQGDDLIAIENAAIVAKDWTDTNAHLPFDIAAAQNAVQSIGEVQGNGVTVEFGSDVFLADQAGWVDDMTAAWKQWGNHGRLDVKLNFVDYGNDVLAFATARNEFFTGQTDQYGTPITQSNVGVEVNTGKDMNGDLPDITITIAMNLAEFGLYNRVSILAHEIGHGLVFRTEAFDFDSDFSTITSWDAQLSFPTGTQGVIYFNGPESSAIYGGPVPITGYYNATHPLTGTGSVMGPTFGVGEIRPVGVLDIAMTNDAGIMV